MGVEEAAGETPSLKGEFIRESHRVVECTQAHPPGNQHQKGRICLWVAGEVTEKWQRAEQVPLFPLRPFPTYSITKQPHGLPCPGEHLRLYPLLHNRQAETKKHGPNERTAQSSRKNTTKLARASQPIRCTVQNTSNQDAHRNG